jgi:ATP-dependent Zn protease
VEKKNVTSGYSISDIRQSDAVDKSHGHTVWLFRQKVGVVFHDLDENETAAETKACIIDAEVAKRIADSSYQRAKKLLTKQKKEHKLVAERLLEFETLTGEEVRNIVLHKRKPVRASKPQAAAAAAAAADKKNNSSNTTTTTLK